MLRGINIKAIERQVSPFLEACCKKSHMCVGSHVFCIFFSVIRPFLVFFFQINCRFFPSKLSSLLGTGAVGRELEIRHLSFF